MKKTISTVGAALRAIALALPLLLLGGGWGEVFAQSITPEVVSSGGGDTTTTNVSLSWTIGEPVIETASGSSATITQGFHQSHFEVVTIEDHSELGFDIKVYPNPSIDFIKVDLTYTGSHPVLGKTEFELILRDNAGKILMSNIIKNKLNATIPMQGYAVGQYFLQIKGADGALYKSVQITKLK